MSERWPGGIVRATPVTPTGPLQNGTAPGVWTLDQANYWIKQGLWPTAGNFLAVEDVFSTWLYTGNGSTQTITNGINLSGQGGMVWIKSRSLVGSDHWLADTARGSSSYLRSNFDAAAATGLTNLITAFNSNGFALGSNSVTNGSPNTYASWTFREAPNFFDVVTYTGTGANQNIAHSLGSVPGMILIKRTDTTSDWQVYHRSNANTQYMVLNTTAAVATGTTRWNSTTPTSSMFTVGTDATVNASGGTYVAYLYAHDTSSTGIIQCGSFTTDGSGNATVNLGWEPQWFLLKSANAAENWQIIDNMRNWSQSGFNPVFPNTSGAELSLSGNLAFPTATGCAFNAKTASTTYIYIAIRRGPMRTPTLGTSVFSPVSQTPSGVTTITTGFPVDMTWFANRSKASFSFTGDVDRLRGTTQTSTNILSTNTTDAEGAVGTYGFGYDRMTSITDNYSNSNWGATTPVIYWNFRRAPSFFDEVCYTGTGASPQTLNHNLGVAPELMIFKSRSGVYSWAVYAAPTWGASFGGGAGYNMLTLNTINAANFNNNHINATQPTSSVFYVGSSVASYNATNGAGLTYVAYLFASCPGVSKVGSYTGNGSSQTINCGFTTGARFVLIKRADDVGDWYVWDSARGISSGNDPYLLLNSTAAEVTGTNYVDTDTTGFKVTAAAPAALNANGGTYIFLAVA